MATSGPIASTAVQPFALRARRRLAAMVPSDIEFHRLDSDVLFRGDLWMCPRPDVRLGLRVRVSVCTRTKELGLVFGHAHRVWLSV